MRMASPGEGKGTWLGWDDGQDGSDGWDEDEEKQTETKG